MPDEYLWPARNVAEHAYCPRLFYFMEVEGVHYASTDTVEGKATHRRVDKPSRLSPVEPNSETPGDAKPQSVRSLTLTSSRLRLTATLDLAEIDGNTAVPVEYRKGKPRQIMSDDGAHSEPWPTDTVQLGLQALLLREHGYQVETSAVYYESTRQRIAVPVDDLLIQNALAELQSAQATAGGPRPEPLRNDPRCNGCSLRAHCLPDEFHALRGESAPPRLPWPPRSEGLIVIAQSQGTYVGIRGGALRVSSADGVKLTEIPMAGIESLALVGNIQLSTQALHELASSSIPIAYLSSAGRLVACIDPLDSVSASVRRAQVLELERPSRRADLARALIDAKIGNQRVLLQRNGNDESAARALSELRPQVREATDVDRIRGLEGYAAKRYFAAFGKLLNAPWGADFEAHGRKRRPAPDPVNAVLSMAYTMLSHESVAALRQARLEPSIGALHVPRPGRPALALDLMEPFRPLIADSIALTAFNRNEFTVGDFANTAAGCLLTESGRRAFFSIWQRRMETEVTHPFFGYKLSYRRMLILHARMIASWLLGENPTLSFLTTR